MNDRRPGVVSKFQKIEKQFARHLVLSRHHRKLPNYDDNDDLSVVISPLTSYKFKHKMMSISLLQVLSSQPGAESV